MENGLLFPVKTAFGLYLKGWFDGLYSDTESVAEYSVRDYDKAVVMAPARMVDSAEDMLKLYQKNTMTGIPGKNALFPIVICAMAKDYIPTGADFGARQIGRKLVSLTDEPDASVYGYRQAMGDVRVQVVVMAAEPMTAQSLAAQLCLYFGEIKNRRFNVQNTWGEYNFLTVSMLESPDVIFMDVKSDNSNMTILAADITLKVTLPMLDAPKPGQDNDGSNHNPPGYPVVTQAQVTNETTGHSELVMEPVDTSALVYSLAAAALLDEIDYTPESWTVLDAAVTAGQAVLADPTEPQRIVSISAKNINAAIIALVPAP